MMCESCVSRGVLLTWHLLPFSLVDGAEAQREGKDEENVKVLGWPLSVPAVTDGAVHRADSVVIHVPVNDRSDGKAVTEKEGVDQGIDHPHGARYHLVALKLQAGTQYHVAR
jgi:hypothetical protein